MGHRAGWTDVENLAPIVIRSPDRPAHSVVAIPTISAPIFNLLAPELFFFNFSTLCIQNVNNTGTKYVRIMKQTAF